MELLHGPLMGPGAQLIGGALGGGTVRGTGGSAQSCGSTGLGPNSQRNAEQTENPQFFLAPSQNGGHGANGCPLNRKDRREDTDNRHCPEQEPSSGGTAGTLRGRCTPPVTDGLPEAERGHGPDR